jgi:hypothetical protein
MVRHAMPKPKWAPDNGGVGCGQTRFLGIWRANKKRMQKSGYSVRKSDTGEWQVRFIPRHDAGWPPINPKTVFIDKKFKRSLCFECGKVDLIYLNDEHKACTLCGAQVTANDGWRYLTST